MVMPGDTPDYRIKSAEVAGLDFEWRDRSHLPPRSRRRRLNNGTDSSFPRRRFGHSLNKVRERRAHNNKEFKTTESFFVNVKIKTEMDGQIISIEFCFSFPTIYHNDMYANGKVPPKIILLYGGICLPFTV